VIGLAIDPDAYAGFFNCNPLSAKKPIDRGARSGRFLARNDAIFAIAATITKRLASGFLEIDFVFHAQDKTKRNLISSSNTFFSDQNAM